MQTFPREFGNHPDQYAPSDEEFIPQILRDFEAGRTVDVVVAVGTSAMIAAEAALFIMEQRGPTVAKRFLELIRSYARG